MAEAIIIGVAIMLPVAVLLSATAICYIYLSLTEKGDIAAQQEANIKAAKKIIDLDF